MESPVRLVELKQRRHADLPFFLIMGGLSATFVLLIVLLLMADVLFTSVSDFKAALLKPEIQAAFRLTLLSCTVAALMSLWVATPLGYLLSRYRFPGRWLVDTLVDIPIVLPPLVLGLSSLRAAHLVPVEAEVADEHGVLRPVALLPTLVADFLERQRNGGNGTV